MTAVRCRKRSTNKEQGSNQDQSSSQNKVNKETRYRHHQSNVEYTQEQKSELRQAQVQAAMERYKHYLKPSASGRPMPIPSDAAWGWSEMPNVVKVMMLSTLSGVITFITPFWGYIQYEYGGKHATFGLWQLCFDNHQCRSISDNIVTGRDVPAWYQLIQFTFLIGVACVCFSFSVIVCHTDGAFLEMSPVPCRMVLCVMGIALLQIFWSLYTFVTYFDYLDFLYVQADEVDVYNGYYGALLTFALTLAAIVMILVDDEINIPAKTRRQQKYNLERQKRFKLKQKLQEANAYQRKESKKIPSVQHTLQNEVHNKDQMYQYSSSDVTCHKEYRDLKCRHGTVHRYPLGKVHIL